MMELMSDCPQGYTLSPLITGGGVLPEDIEGKFFSFIYSGDSIDFYKYPQQQKGNNQNKNIIRDSPTTPNKGSSWNPHMEYYIIKGVAYVVSIVGCGW